MYHTYRYQEPIVAQGDEFVCVFSEGFNPMHGMPTEEMKDRLLRSHELHKQNLRVASDWHEAMGHQAMFVHVEGGELSDHEQDALEQMIERAHAENAAR